jgi:DNA polymerase
MGPERFREQCAQAGILIDEEQACFIVKSYRKSNPCITGLWKKMEAAAIKTVQSRIPRTCVDGRISFEMKDQVLRMILPSGRAIHYHNPRTIKVETPWNELVPALRHHGVNTVTRKWTEQRTYGGRLVENAVQAIARDILAEALMRMESEGWNIILSVHDELIAECDEDHADLEEFTSLMASVPEWATGCPIEAEGWISTRYRK